MIISSELLAAVSQATKTSTPPGTELVIPDAVLPVASFGNIPILQTGTVGATFTDSFMSDAQIDQTNVAASSRMLLAIRKGLWRITWFWDVRWNFAPTFGNFSSLCWSQDNGVSFVRFASITSPAAIGEYRDRGSFVVLVGNTNLQIIEFEMATTGAGNRAVWTSGFYGEKLL